MNKHLHHAIKDLEDVISDHHLEIHSSKMEQLKSKLTDGRFIVTVLGEFNRGKSSLLNSLLGQTLLPIGVLPTTATINVIHSGDAQEIKVHYKGDLASEILSPTEFKDLSKTDEAKLSQINYIEVTSPDIELPPDVILVDTPGVNDINEHREAITYGFIPNSDATILVLSASTPLKKTELDFLKSNILGSHIERILFVLNKVDQIEAQELDEVLTDLELRLTENLEVQKVNIFPLVSKSLFAKAQSESSERYGKYLKNFKSYLSEFLTESDLAKSRELR